MSERISEYSHKLKMFAATRFTKAKPDNVFSYRPLLDREDLQIFKRSAGAKRIECAHESVVVLSRKGRIYIYPDYRYPSVSYTVTFGNKSFPGLIEGSKIAYCRVLPYLRKITEKSVFRAWRLMVVTDKGQIYHNYPSRAKGYDGRSLIKDIVRFEESVVWDMPGRKHPTKNKDVKPFERYYPCLPDKAYEYHPMIDKKSPYGNEGFSASYESELGILPRFYIARREPQGNPFYYMSGFSADTKMSVMATYRGNLSVGVRTCIFISDDGGRQWFCKYEFGDLGEYAFKQGTSAWGRNFGNTLSFPSCDDTRITLTKRTCVIPCDREKEPETKFNFAEEISFVAKNTEGKTVFVSDTAHGYETGNIVSVSFAENPLEWMINSEVNESSAGNGLFFKVEAVDEKTVALYEYVASPYNPISCRHIHHVNRVRDGWIIGTGEIYPNSWILYMQMKEADTFADRSASSAFDVYRLNSSEHSVQRTLGFLWTDNDENTVMYASDHDVLEDKTVQFPIDDRSVSFSRGATGVYLGKLSNIDDHNKFTPVFEAKEPAYLLQNFGGVTVFSGQRGELAISRDGGKTWNEAHIDGALNHHKGGTFAYQIFDDYLLKIKYDNK